MPMPTLMLLNLLQLPRNLNPFPWLLPQNQLQSSLQLH
jgi:hypothetical protein